MGVMRLRLALLLFALTSAGILFLSDYAYALCMCGQACPQPSCGACNPRCYPPLHNDLSDNSVIHMRNVHTSRSFISDSSENRTGFTLVAIPQGLFSLQCQRLREMLQWAGDFQDGISTFRQSVLQ